jgi:TATA-box binding protein (TBP) (component of TFIID and TFIIIB)
MTLTREAILDAGDLQAELVEVPEWGGSVFVRSMTGTERDQFESEAYTVKGKNVEMNRENFRARLLVRVLVDEANQRLFSPTDMVALGAKSAKALDRLFTVAMKINGLSKEDVEDLTKNS